MDLSKIDIKELFVLMQKKIDEKMEEFNALGKESKELLKQAHAKEKKMAEIYQELGPVQYLIRTQNPELCDLFDSLVELTKETRKDDHGNK